MFKHLAAVFNILYNKMYGSGKSVHVFGRCLHTLTLMYHALCYEIYG